MLTKDRPEMARQTVECFRRQTYESKFLCVYDTCDTMLPFGDGFGEPYVYGYFPDHRDLTIGTLRNLAIERGHAMYDADIILHFDDDDLSHPNRIAEQVALLQSSGAECVGYNEVLFWDIRSRNGYCRDYSKGSCCDDKGQRWVCTFPCQSAWIYRSGTTNQVIGGSLCYWREVWERNPFPDAPKAGNPNASAEDTLWLRKVRACGVSGVGDEPRMVCRIHGKNTMAYELEKHKNNWFRVPERDDRVRAFVEAA